MTARWGSPSLISRVHVTKARSCDWQRWNMSTISWITDYLTGRLQYVRLSVLLMGSTCHLQKYSDCGVDGSISDEQEKEYRAQVDDFVESSGRNHLLQIRGGDGVWLQNKETCPTTNTGQDVDVVDEYLTTRGWIWRLTQRLWKKKWMSSLFFPWNWNPSMCAQGFLSLSCSEHIVLCCVLQGEAASELETPADWITWRGRQALWFLANWTLLKLWWRGGHWKNCNPSL